MSTTTALSLLRDAVEAAAQASVACQRDTLTVEAGHDLARLVAVLADATELAGYAQEVRSSAQAAVLQLLPDYGAVTVEGVGTVTRRSGTQRKAWDHDRIRSLILARTLDRLTNDDGEIRHGPGTVAEAVADAFAEAAGVGYWRVTALRELGVNPDAVCTKESGPDRVEFQPEGGA